LEGANRERALMTDEKKDSLDQADSEPANEENEKSEEFLNFERGIDALLSIPPKDAKKIVEKTPFKKSGPAN
jgi:hypothetical protein